ncbi:MAG: GNAT family N-acetyltransferase [Sedimentisphaerales bacterium]|nr:GNAT family N-acetyltransferase [Sedimentisphaerales bacterium]
MNPITISSMTINDYNAALTLWQNTEGICLDDCDSPTAIARYLQHNPGLSCVAKQDNQLIGTLLCGTDGRRGYLNHLAVAPTHRNQGIGRKLVQHSLNALKNIGITRCHTFVLVNNSSAQAFWQHIGWPQQDTFNVRSITP